MLESNRSGRVYDHERRHPAQPPQAHRLTERVGGLVLGIGEAHERNILRLPKFLQSVLRGRRHRDHLRVARDERGIIPAQTRQMKPAKESAEPAQKDQDDAFAAAIVGQSHATSRDVLQIEFRRRL